MCRRGPATDSATVELAETAAVIGYIRGRLFLVVLTLRERILRVISLRLADQQERARYAKAKSKG